MQLSAGDNSGYRGPGLALLSSQRLAVGDLVEIQTDEGRFSGVIMPRYLSASDEYLVIKLKSGYNAGIRVSNVRSATKLPAQQANPPLEKAVVSQDKSLPRVALISTGGTIASKIDYRTGGVRAALSAEELYSSVPELADVAWVDPEVLLSEYSENMEPRHWTAIAAKVAEKIKAQNYDGIVISHGTDTMHYTAAALSFALQKLPVPVVLVGAQRSSDRPSSDAALNLVGATLFAARSPVAGVFVAMHAGTSDDSVAVHLGTRVRKNHTSRRDAFESIDVDPVAIVRNRQIELLGRPRLAARGENNSLDLRPGFDGRVMLAKFYPGFNPNTIQHAIDSGYRAIVIEGTGLGHVSKELFPYLRRAVEAGVIVCMTSQCIWGRVRMTVYDTGRDLLDIGVVPLSDMTSETATVKAMWVLANEQDSARARLMMQQTLAGETTDSIPIA